MAIEVIREKESSTLTSLDVPYYVRDEAILPGSQLDRDDAVAAAAAQALIDQGDEAQDYRADRLTYNVVRVTIQYREIQLSPLTPLASGSIEAGFNALPFQPVHKLQSLGNIRAFGAVDGLEKVIGSGTGEVPPLGGCVNVAAQGRDPNLVYGYEHRLPPETDYVDYVIPQGSFTAAYRAVVNSLLYKVHQSATPFFGFDSGEVMLVRAQARKRSNADLFLSFGFSTIANGPRTVNGVTTENSVDGHDLDWTRFWVRFLNEQEEIVPTFIYIARIWPRADLHLLALPGSGV